MPDGHSIASELLRLMKFADYHLASGDEHPANALYFSDCEHPPMSEAPAGPDMDIRWPPHCVRGTEGAKLLPGLPAKHAYDLYIAKGEEVDQHPYGACYHDLLGKQCSGAIPFLKSCKVEVVLVGGLATEFCVKETVLQLLGASLKVIVDVAGCRSMTQDGGQKAIEKMLQKGAIVLESANELEILANE